VKAECYEASFYWRKLENISLRKSRVRRGKVGCCFFKISRGNQEKASLDIYKVECRESKLKRMPEGFERAK
jgi:hypothetical protein